jgi:hypothetical protein
MTYRKRIRQPVQQTRALAKDPRHRTHSTVTLDHLSVAGSYARRLLAAVLKGVKAQIRLCNGFRVAKYPEKTALLFLVQGHHIPNRILQKPAATRTNRQLSLLN